VEAVTESPYSWEHLDDCICPDCRARVPRAEPEQQQLLGRKPIPAHVLDEWTRLGLRKPREETEEEER
jgi:hypothetical protein